MKPKSSSIDFRAIKLPRYLTVNSTSHFKERAAKSSAQTTEAICYSQVSRWLMKEGHSYEFLRF